MSDEFIHYEFVADKGQNPLRVDKFLMNFIENATRNKIQKAADSGNIYVNGITVKSSHKVKSEDIVKIIYDYPKREIELVPQDIPLDIKYEDDDILILNKEAGEKQLNELGFDPKDLEKLTKAISSPQGMVLVTGPTGSGKTTTLYSVLKHINQPGMNILTAEDPVEYELEGIGQVQVKEAIDFTFESALR